MNDIKIYDSIDVYIPPNLKEIDVDVDYKCQTTNYCNGGNCVAGCGGK